MIGKTLGHYEILAPLGAGGMGQVYRARDTTLDRDVAIKVLPEDFASDAGRLARFEREAKLLASLNHPNIATIFGFEESDGVRFIAMELVEGQTLAEQINASGRIPVAVALEIARQIALALEAAHEAGVIHRDLKPDNVKITLDFKVKVLDFGLAKAYTLDGTEPSSDLTLSPTTMQPTVTGVIMGTAPYMSPEQARGQPVDKRTDIWAFGCVLYEMLAGKRAFDGKTIIDTMAAILKEEPEWGSVPDEVPWRVVDLLRLCMVKNSDRRLHDIADARIWIINAIDDPDRGIPRPTTSATDAAGGGARRTPQTWIAAVALAVATLAVAWGLSRGGEARPGLEFGPTHRVTVIPGLEVHPAISPDGSMVAYAAGAADGRMRLFVRQLAGGRALALTEGPWDAQQEAPAWSPDGTQIAFNSGGRVFVVPAFGGVPRELVESADWGGVAWSPDGASIAFVRSGSLMRQEIDGGELQELASPPVSNAPAWSPDGVWIAVVSRTLGYAFGNFVGNIASSAIWLISTEGGEPVLVIDDGRVNASPQWLPSSRELLFVSDRDGKLDLYGITIAPSGEPTGPPRRLSTGLDVHTFTLSADGSRLAYAELEQRSNIWSIDIPGSDAPVSIVEAQPVTEGSQAIEGIAVSPDREWLAFDSDRWGDSDIYRMPLAGGPLEQLTDDPADDFMPAFSPDGSEIVFYSFRNGSRDLYVMSATGTRERQVTAGPAQDRYPHWSPDGNSLVFHSDRTGRQEIWMVAREERDGDWAEPVQLTTDGGVHARWSPLGDTVAYGTPSGLWLIPVVGGAARLLVGESSTFPPFPNWSRDGQTIYYTVVDARLRAQFWAVPAAGGEPRLLVFDDPSMPSYRSHWATDGERFYFTIAEMESDIWVIELGSR